MILVPLTISISYRKMQQPKQDNITGEDNDRNRQEPHDPAQAGSEAIEAGKLNEKGRPAGQQAEESADAERWRNEG